MKLKTFRTVTESSLRLAGTISASVRLFNDVSVITYPKSIAFTLARRVLRFFLTFSCVVAASVMAADEEGRTNPSISGKAVGQFDTPQMRGAIGRVDMVLAQVQARHDATYNEAVEDHVFLRRVYLNVVGTIPNLEQAESFLADASPDKRKRLISDLLNSEGYVSHSFNYFGELWRIKSVQGLAQGSVWFNFYIDWLKRQLRESRPYNEIVRDLFLAKGRLCATPQSGFLIRDVGSPLDRVSYVTKSILGADISCAQCHDDPKSDWTQKQFYEFAASLSQLHTFEGGRTGRFGYSLDGRFMQDYLEKFKKEKGLAVEPTPYMRGQWRRYSINLSNTYRGIVFAPWRLHVKDIPSWSLKYPASYEYDESLIGKDAVPHSLLGDPIDQTSPRAAIADWVSSADNRMLSRTIANHYWFRFFGRPLVEPLHDIYDRDSAFNAVLDQLADELVGFNFDLKAFTWLLTNTLAYQSESNLSMEATEHSYFSGPFVARLTAAQIWDSLVTLKTEDPYRYVMNPGVVEAAAVNEIENDEGPPVGGPLDVDVAYRRIDSQRLLSSGALLDRYNGASAHRLGLSGEVEYMNAFTRYFDQKTFVLGGGAKLETKTIRGAPFSCVPHLTKGSRVTIPFFVKEYGLGRRTGEAYDIFADIASGWRVRTVLELQLSEDPKGEKVPLKSWKMVVKDGKKWNFHPVKLATLSFDRSGPHFIHMRVKDGGGMCLARAACISKRYPRYSVVPVAVSEAASGKGGNVTDGPAMTQMMMPRMEKQFSSAEGKEMGVHDLLARASELRQPAEVGHFLQVFGQSQRDFQVNASTRRGAILQIMEFMNGSIISQLTEGSKLRLDLDASGNVVDAAFLSILNRRPTNEERRIAATTKSTEELIWALLNSPEFIFVD